MNGEWWMRGLVVWPSVPTWDRERRARGSLSLKPHHRIELTHCICSTDTWIRAWLCVCTEAESTEESPSRPMLLALFAIIDDHFKYGNIWLHSHAWISTQELIQNQFTLFLFSLKIATAGSLWLGCMRLLLHMCPLTASLCLYYTPCHSLFKPWWSLSNRNCHRLLHFSIFVSLWELGPAERKNRFWLSEASPEMDW